MRTLILGGVRSGKSRMAAALAAERAWPVTLIATAQALDEEMAARIEAHRAERPRDWTIVEEPLALAAAIENATAPGRTVIVDCLTLWLTNLLLSEDVSAPRRASGELLEVLARAPGEIMLVSNEVGLGIIPAPPLARRFADEAGTLHQRIAAVCERVVLMVAGVALEVRGTPDRTDRPC